MPGYEWRWKTDAFAGHRRQCPAPRWLGDRSISGKTILLHAEQGFGDTIQFIRYAPLLARRGVNVVCEVQPELQPLLAQLAEVEVIARGEPLPAFDLHCSLLSLPLAFGTRPGTIPAEVPYLAASAERCEYWRERLPAGGPRAGFVWSGSPSHKNDSSRSIPLARLAASFAALPLPCISLQSELRDTDREVLQGLPNLIHLGDDVRDFADTAAIVSLLDVLVSVDTAAAHLAGAMGRPVVILLPHAADFRWMRERDDLAWYPTAKLCGSRPLAIGTACSPGCRTNCGHGARADRSLVNHEVRCVILRDARKRAPLDEVSDPHGEERGSAARLEPRGQRTRRQVC